LHRFIPPAIANCTQLRALYLRDKYLDGEIYVGLGKLSNLMILDLSNNSLKGPIPPSVGQMSRLKFLNLSTNFLAGELPKIRVLQGFGNHSFVGDLDLCGQQLDTLCKKSLGFPVVLPDSDCDADPTSTKPSGRISKESLLEQW
jgi:hypothetical protein